MNPRLILSTVLTALMIVDITYRIVERHHRTAAIRRRMRTNGD